MRDASAASRVLVAGGAGFIGSHLCDWLIESGFEVVCMDNLQTGRMSNIDHLRNDRRFEFVEADVIEELPASIRAGQFSRIYNLACAASPPHYQADPEHTLLTNVLGTRNLLRLAERQGARFLLASTSEVYGEPEVHPQPETYRGSVSCTGPRACYDEGKRAAETLAFDFDRQGRADVRVVRIFNTYGPRMSPDDGRVVSNVICQAISGDPITIYGDGQQTRSFCYVSDLVRGLAMMMAHDGPQPGPVNLGTPHEITVAELARLVRELIPTRSELICMPLPEDDPCRRKPDIGKAVELLGWMPMTSLREGLERTAFYFREEMGSGAAGQPVSEEQLAAAE